jgi:hypothetical protein
MTAADRIKARFVGLTMVDVSPRGTKPTTLREDLDQLLDDYDAMCVSGKTLIEILINRMKMEEERENLHKGAWGPVAGKSNSMLTFWKASALAMLASSSTAAIEVPQRDWYIIDPSTSSCVKPTLSPRDFETQLRTEGSKIASIGVIRDPDGTIRTVTVRYKVQDDDNIVVFWPALAPCKVALQRLIDAGKTRPPE